MLIEEFHLKILFSIFLGIKSLLLFHIFWVPTLFPASFWQVQNRLKITSSKKYLLLKLNQISSKKMIFTFSISQNDLNFSIKV